MASVHKQRVSVLGPRATAV